MNKSVNPVEKVSKETQTDFNSVNFEETAAELFWNMVESDTCIKLPSYVKKIFSNT